MMMMMILFVHFLAGVHPLALGTPSTELKRTLRPLAPGINESSLNLALTYGKWCGGGHGGYEDCCNGGPCPSCETNSTGISVECIKECPPEDSLDAQCAFHDHCTYAQSLTISCQPQGNFCPCDCLLVTRATQVRCSETRDPVACTIYAGEICQSFSHDLSCFYLDGQGNEVCDGVFTGGIPLDTFCPKTGTTLWDSACIPDESGPNQYCNPNQNGEPVYLCYDGYQPNGNGTCVIVPH